MAQWALLLFSLCGALQAQEFQPPTILKCCQEGRDGALREQDCSILPLISSSHTCRIAQERCCEATVLDKLCDQGIEMAQSQGACEMPFFEGDLMQKRVSKICCDCCMLGLTGLTLDCELPGLTLGKLCEDTAKACCVYNTEATPKAEGSSCSQLSAANGTCDCDDGYLLGNDGVTCEDIDECALGTHNCGPDFTCNNTVGSFGCHRMEGCTGGFIQDAIGHCIDINECVAMTSPCLPGHTCINTEGSYTCRRSTLKCERGYHLTQNGTCCEDVDECRTGNVCGIHGCVNLVGSYRCECRIGFVFNSINRLCEDIDECALPAGGHVCSYQCSNTPGSFYCTCPCTGYTLTPNGRTCQDIDECAAETHSCSDSEGCYNVQGGFRCLNLQCPQSFRKLSQGSKPDVSMGLRCIKDCPFGDAKCALNPLHIITNSVISLPYFINFSAPEEIVFLRTVVAAFPPDPSRVTNVSFEITLADKQFSFDVEKRFHQNKVMGVVRQVKPIIGPRDLELTVAINYVKSGAISHQNVVVIRIFISEFWF